MNKVYTLKNKKVQFLISSDVQLGSLIKSVGTAELELEANGFRCLVKYIIGQQISDKARETIWKKLCRDLHDIKPSVLLATDLKSMRKIGLSRRKISYIYALAKSVDDNTIDFKKLKILSNEKIISSLTKVYGIGRWTSEMYLIFSLGRENVLSTSDGTIQRSIKSLYNLDDLPSRKKLIEYFNKWKGYETIVSVYLWNALKKGLI
ncbi:DNA-3-methyladenine glycosylase family protein [Lactobacillus helsingborgensis]|uniref:DNA-3-methyladenine glycosylase family protein n=1 Tax=Lactobacillus helsingborgensis TaxID=1218494 RepID=UPI00164F4B10|nr:DNA-3-methyladenine glycosylase 2 family protein [Lactobacillus helsingborgensis]